jgi:hypothetical protein
MNGGTKIIFTHSPSEGLVVSTTCWIRYGSFNLMDIIRAANTHRITYQHVTLIQQLLQGFHGFSQSLYTNTMLVS